VTCRKSVANPPQIRRISAACFGGRNAAEKRRICGRKAAEKRQICGDDKLDK